ncbi:MAG TPA: polysaccharide biosynthesis tyrosine autokinase [Trueperaceae bacterium]
MQQEITVDIGALFRFIARGLILALLVGGALAFVALQLSRRQPPVYEAEATVLAAQTNPEFRQFGLSLVTAPPLDVSAYRAAGTSDPVLAEALRRMGAENPTDTDIRRLRGRISVQAEETVSSSLIYVSGQGSTPGAAANRANAVANAMVSWDRARASEDMEQLVQSLELQIANLSEQIRSLQTLNDPSVADQIAGRINLRAERQEQLSYARALSASATPLLSVLQPANPPGAPISPRPMLNAAVAFILGVLATYGLLLLRRALDTRLTGVADLAHAAGLPVLAEFPRFHRLDKNTLREASSYLRTNLLFSTADTHPKIFLISSAQGGEGKTVTATSLAEGFVRNGYRTLLVDADLRSPSLAKMYRISGGNRSSLADWLQEPYGQHQPVEVSVSPKQHLSVIPVFQPVNQPSELLSIGFRSCLEKWRQEYDVILIDSAPILAVADSLTIAPFCTGTILVTHLQKTDRNQIRTAVDLVRRIGARVLGVVATHVQNESGRGPVYGYGYSPPQEPGAPSDRSSGGGMRSSLPKAPKPTLRRDRPA